MVDFVKVAYQDGSVLRKNPLLNFETIADSEALEKQVNYDIAKYKGLKFQLWESNFLLVTGSLHYFFNNDKHNHNDFSHSSLVAVLKEFEQIFDLELKKGMLQNIEFGVNIKPFCDTSSILDNLIHHKTERFTDGNHGKFKEAIHQQYYVKIYDKANQFKLSEQKMRFELKFKKMQKVNYFDIRCLNDLLSTEWVESIGELLLKEWSNVLIFDTTIDKQLFRDKNKELKLFQWQNINYWLNLDKSNRAKELKKYKNCVKNHSLEIQLRNGLIIKNKWLELANS